MRALGFSRRSLRIVCAAWRTASAGDGAGVDDDGIVEPGRGGVPAHHLGLEGVEPAAERDDADALDALSRMPPSRPDAGAAVAMAGDWLRWSDLRARSLRPRVKPSPASSTPSCSSSTGPVIKMWSSARHSMSSGPPGSVTVTCAPVSPLRAAHTVAAQAALPQALVRPAPRSQVRSVIALAASRRGRARCWRARERSDGSPASGRCGRGRRRRHRRPRTRRAGCRR